MLPAIIDFDSLGGCLQNYAPVEDPTTDLDASADNETRANVAAMTQTLPRALCRGTLDVAPSVAAHRAVWGNSGSVAPAIIRTSVGVFDVIWPASVVDDLGVAQNVLFVAAQVSIGYGFGWHANVLVAGPNTVQVVVFDTSNAAADPVNIPFSLVVY